MSQSLKSRQNRGKAVDLFLGRAPQEVINEFYMLDLKKIIGHNWDVFSPVFDGNQQRFEMNMDTINVARRSDSHTKPVSSDELDDFNNSYDWILIRLRRVPLVTG
jgi:hypothetical protein